jgi:UV radiation resistance-associated gene protein
VNEDSVATALGYAALVVQMTAAYLCQRLMYPITYVGSRSLVKDPISAMVGPRM